MLVVSLVLLGLVVGPLVGVVVDRAVERLPLRPEHRCSTCQLGLGSSSLIPVLSWRTRCSGCGNHKGWCYPLVDLGLAMLFPLIGNRFGWDWMLAPYLALTAVLVALSAIDAGTHLLPNVIVWPSIWASLFLVIVLSGVADYPGGINSALLGAAVFSGVIGFMHLVHEQGMGRGDVKLSVLLGLFVGWLQTDLVMAARLVLFAIVLASFGAAVIGTAYNLIRRRGRAEIPFGPALAAGTLAIVVLSPVIV